MIGSRRPRPQQPPGAAIQQLRGCGGIAFGLFGLFFAVFSLICMVSAASTAWNDWWQTRNWQQVEAQLESCEVTFSPEPRAEADAEGDGRAFQLKMSYRYEYGGRSFTSNRWHKETAGSDLYEPFGKAEARLKSARPLYCLINPDRPDEAILERRSEGLGMVVWGLPFFLVGVGLIVIGRKASKVTDATTTMEEASPLGSLLLGGAFVSVFLAAGLFGCWQGISALIAGNRAKTWPKTPCEIVRTGWNNDVRQVLYRYTVSGETYHCDRVRPAGGMNFIGGSPHWEPGARTTCRVDPSDPRSAVLRTESRGWQAMLIGVSFLAVGLFGAGAVILVYRQRKARQKKTP